ncbi:Mediator of RNA polymerase II transcription subunit 10 [Malassezia restricta CBS 7877]|uniref:Mediator of RNA polymerase II transcription subunit 10 n=1 Tax=Malassezia restricta (strain ATCC 96810 / NBRC 103918 / CBS 7877) TaxID=425264 RepID=A0A3G2SB73_MALR7|nr:Mediator of RNA polymerase II transcription subunit 10 [Malassezia restricta CBS 7877]
MDEGRRPPTPTSASLSPPRADMAHSAEVQAPRSVEEIVRSDLDVRTHAVTDALYRLASHVALDQQAQSVGEMVNDVVRSLADVDVMRGHIHDHIPQEVVDLVDAGRNPDSHTRSFMNRLASENQYSLGQYLSIKAFRDQLAPALSQAFPELETSLQHAMQQHTDTPYPTH